MFANREDADKVTRYRPLAELVPVHWTTGSIEAGGGARIHYTRTGGPKPALLLLHGVQVNGLMWLRTAMALEATYDVVMPDFRGHGQSARAETGVSSDLLVSDTVALIHTLALDRPFVVGHSMSAEVAGRLAAVHPLRAVVLVDPALQNFAAMMPANSDELPPYMLPIIEAMQALRTQTHEERMVTGLRLLPPGTPVWEEADYVSFVEGMAQFDLTLFRHIAAMGRPLFEQPEVIAQIACPLLLLTAHPMMPGANIEPGLAAYKANWRDGQHVHFEDSGHFIPGDQFNRFVDVLARFLSEH